VLCMLVDSWEQCSGVDWDRTYAWHKRIEAHVGRRPGPKLTRQEVLDADFVPQEQKEFIIGVLGLGAGDGK